MCVGFSEGVDIDKGEPEIRNLQGFFKCWYLTANKFPTGYIQNETVRDFFFPCFSLLSLPEKILALILSLIC